jgi:hypothetical protein
VAWMPVLVQWIEKISTFKCTFARTTAVKQIKSRRTVIQDGNNISLTGSKKSCFAKIVSELRKKSSSKVLSTTVNSKTSSYRSMNKVINQRVSRLSTVLSALRRGSLRRIHQATTIANAANKPSA